MRREAQEAGRDPLTAEEIAASPSRRRRSRLGCAAAARAANLVTGSVRHFPPAARPKGLRVELPAAFLRRLARAQR